MRRPTPREHVYDWHSRAIRGERMPIHDSTPHAGWYLARLQARGAYVPGSIWLEQPTDPDTGELIGDEVYRAEILGEPRDADDAWLWLAKRPICKLYYMQRLAEIF